jgi:hypothetical protein
MRLDTPTAGSYDVGGSETVVALVVADAGGAATTRNPLIDATLKNAVMRARRIPPPHFAFPRWAKYEVYGRTSF